MIMNKLCSISIDVDTVDCYLETFGLKKENSNVIYEKIIPRFLSIFDKHGIKATFFVVGRDVGKNADILSKLSKKGHEIANHTMNHIHHLNHLPYDKKLKEVKEAHEVLETVSENEVVGFRAPGYNIDSQVIEILDGLDYTYDSSIHPTFFSPLIKFYVSFLARGKQKSRGMGDIKHAFAPTKPYYPSENFIWKKGDRKILEIPISTVPPIRLPFFGSVYFGTGKHVFDLSYLMVKNFSDILTYELHAIELSDYVKDGINPNLRRNPGMNLTLEQKLSLYDHLFSKIKKSYKVVPEREVANFIMKNRV